ncbi:hypothetical protein IFM89_035452 [Coptis chinensis]|uniref:Uncharacterized protein n=1 Tax=Coptis chinensis TaxID=261450 RepID=A0A835J262_9MAGN|nr:hypothetical protein IFM89_035452 [Coptis chinensis]
MLQNQCYGVVEDGLKQLENKAKELLSFLKSSPTSLQVIVNSSVTSLSTLMPTSTCVYVEGVLMKTPQDTKMKVELKVKKVLHVGPVDSATYPIPKTKLTLEQHRDFVHMRPRSNTVISDDGESLAGQRIKIGGRVKIGREQGKGTFAFLEVNYGSPPTTLQVIVNSYDIYLSTPVPAHAFMLRVF